MGRPASVAGVASYGSQPTPDPSPPGRGEDQRVSRANAVKSATDSVSARRVASIPIRSSASSAPGTPFRLCRIDKTPVAAKD